MPVSPARATAFEILMRVETTDAYASELLHSSRFAKLSTADHGLATELVMGVLRWRSVLDERIEGNLSATSIRQSRSNPGPVASPLPKTGPGVAPDSRKIASPSFAKLDAEVLTALRLGAYQLLFLDRVPTHAAVNESVELVKRARKRSATGLVNAVLRKIRRADFVPDARSGHQPWLVDRWEAAYGVEVARKIYGYDQSPPETAVRLTAQSGLEVAAEDISFVPGKLLTQAAIVTSGDVSRTKAFMQGRLAIQDEASQLVALVVGNGDSILDCCAAPGGKTRILSEQNPNASIVAMELHPHRAALLKRLVSASNVQVIAADARTIPIAKRFDRILVDTPCTGTGTLARNPEIKWRLKPEDILRLQKLQIQILQAAMNQVSEGGRIIYSTCSLEPEENEQVLESALACGPSFRVVDCRSELEKLAKRGELAWKNIDSLLSGPYLRTIPGLHPCDGFFAALLERI